MKKLFPFIGIGLFLALLTSSCENSGNTFASGNVPNEEYELWNIIPQQSIETFALRITEIPLYKYTTSEYNYNIHTYIEKEYLEKTWLSIQFFENMDKNERCGFLIGADDVYYPLDAITELISALEKIETQIQNDTCTYSCTRFYNTASNLTITYNYDRDKKKWEKINIPNINKTIDIENLNAVIKGLIDCKNSIINYQNGLWDNHSTLK